MFIFNTKVNPYHRLIEEYQYKKIRFAFCEKEKADHYTNITSWVQCRDFLNDAFFIQQLSEKEKTPFNFEVHGFQYKCILGTILNKISVISPHHEDLFNIGSGICNIINPLETNVYPAYKKTGSFLNKNDLTGLPVLTILISPIWLTNTYTLSLFTLLLRLFTYTKQNINVWDNILTYSKFTVDRNLVQNLKQKELTVNQLLLNLTDEKMPGPFDDWDLDEILEDQQTTHEKLGILNGVYNNRLGNYLNSKTKDMECPPDVRAVILF